MELYDLHCHTKLSLCASRESDIAGFVRCAEEDGLVCVGISDHAWEKGIGRPIDFYVHQPYDKLFERERPDGSPVRVFLGAEGEYAQGLLGVSRQTMQKLDYIIIPHSHTHMRDFVLPEGINDNHAHGRWLFNSFVSLLHHPNADCFFGIAHPLWACGKSNDDKNEILSAITDEEFIYCGELAAKKGIFLEMNMSSIESIPLDDFESNQYARFLRLAKKGGAEFFMGSDNHMPACGKANSLNKLPDYAEAVGLVEDDFKTALSRILRA